MRANMNFKNGKWNVRIGKSTVAFDTARTALRFISLWHFAVGQNV